MFSALGKLKSLLVGEELEEEEISPPPLLQDEVSEFEGQVTSLHSGYGLINGNIYFTLTVVEDGRMPVEGSRVTVKARRKHGVGGWMADKVVVSDNDDMQAAMNRLDALWEGGEDTNTEGPATTQMTVGVITAISDGYAVINNTVTFDMSDVASDDFVPHHGDWVKAKVITDGERTYAADVRPLREKMYEGRVNSARDGHGYIDEEIYFTDSACVQGYVPRRGDKVAGRCIESTKGKATWRALKVERPDLRGVDINKIFNSPLIQQNPVSLRSHEELLSDKEGLIIQADEIKFGQISQGREGMAKVRIRNNNSSNERLESCVIRSTTETQFSITTCLPLTILGNSVTTVAFKCSARNLGRDRQLAIFQFSSCQIGRYVSVEVTMPAQFAGLTPAAPYSKRQGGAKRAFAGGNDQAMDAWVVPGEQPKRSSSKAPVPHRLQQYPVDQALRGAIAEGKDVEAVKPVLQQELSLENYSRRFSTLLHLEEIQQEIDIRNYDMERVCLRPCGEYLGLSVPGLAEGRPSVLLGDRVILSEPSASWQHSPQYEGYVHDITRDEVLLKFHADFHASYGGEDFNVRFTFNRTTLRRGHQAAEFIPQFGKTVLFPHNLLPKAPQTRKLKSTTPPGIAQVRVVKDSSPRKKCPLNSSKPKDISVGHKFFNTMLNKRQRAAVVRILNGQSRPTPYILFGPPGTGKTVTLVEAILQVFTHVSGSRIIAAAPSNSAADLLCERLHQSGQMEQGDLVRLNAFQRGPESIPPCILPYCLTGDDLLLVSRHRVVVCTCSSAGALYGLKLNSGHFTHAFVDEAGQATEPECIIPLGLAAANAGQLVLAGDPMQLGPVLQSKLAGYYGLGMSFLQRLIELPLYARDETKFADHGSYDPLLVTKLVENYRSHPALLDLPSQLFYYGELQVSGPENIINCMVSWSELPNTDNCPLIFHGMRGDDLREGSSPSWFNAVEAIQVMKYLQAVLNNGVHPLSYDDIGIITPYRKQVEKIRLLIDKLGLEKIKVGSVEEFQGQERPVMIISTVRSTEKHVGSDRRYNLGFLSNPKRFNVSITRAQALLIIVGNPHVLAQDDNWRALITYAVKNKAYRGCDLPEYIHDEMEQAKEAKSSDDNSNDNDEKPNLPNQDQTSKAHSFDNCGQSQPELDSVESSKSEIKQETFDDCGQDMGVEMDLYLDDDNLSLRNPSSNSCSSASDILICQEVLGNKDDGKKDYSNNCSHIASVDSQSKNKVSKDSADEVESELYDSNQNDKKSVEKSDVDSMNKSREFNKEIKKSQCKNEEQDSSSVSSDSDVIIEESDTDSDSEKVCNESRRSENSDIDTRMIEKINVGSKTEIITPSPPMQLEVCSSPFVDKSQEVMENAGVFLTLQTQMKSDEESKNLVPFIHPEPACDIDINSLNNKSPSPVVEQEKPTVKSGSNPELQCRPDSNTEKESARISTPPFSGSLSNSHWGSETSINNLSGETDAEPWSMSGSALFSPNMTQEQKSLTLATPLEKKIIRQIEYYFGDFNLLQDKFLLDQISKNSDGWVELSVICTFNRMKELSVDHTVISTALRKSNHGIVEVHPSGDKIRRYTNKTLEFNHDKWKSDLRMRTVAMNYNPRTTTVDEIINQFEVFGDIEHSELTVPKVVQTGKNIHRHYFVCVLVYFRIRDAMAMFRAKPHTIGTFKTYLFFRTPLADECVEYLYCRRILKISQRRLKPVGSGFYLHENYVNDLEQSNEQVRAQKQENVEHAKVKPTKADNCAHDAINLTLLPPKVQHSLQQLDSFGAKSPFVGAGDAETSSPNQSSKASPKCEVSEQEKREYKQFLWKEAHHGRLSKVDFEEWKAHKMATGSMMEGPQAASTQETINTQKQTVEREHGRKMSDLDDGNSIPLCSGIEKECYRDGSGDCSKIGTKELIPATSSQSETLAATHSMPNKARESVATSQSTVTYASSPLELCTASTSSASSGSTTPSEDTLMQLKWLGRGRAKNKERVLFDMSPGSSSPSRIRPKYSGSPAFGSNTGSPVFGGFAKLKSPTVESIDIDSVKKAMFLSSDQQELGGGPQIVTDAIEAALHTPVEQTNTEVKFSINVEPDYVTPLQHAKIDLPKRQLEFGSRTFMNRMFVRTDGMEEYFEENRKANLSDIQEVSNENTPNSSLSGSYLGSKPGQNTVTQRFHKHQQVLSTPSELDESVSLDEEWYTTSDSEEEEEEETKEDMKPYFKKNAKNTFTEKKVNSGSSSKSPGNTCHVNEKEDIAAESFDRNKVVIESEELSPDDKSDSTQNDSTSTANNTVLEPPVEALFSDTASGYKTSENVSSPVLINPKASLLASTKNKLSKSLEAQENVMSTKNISSKTFESADALSVSPKKEQSISHVPSEKVVSSDEALQQNPVPITGKDILQELAAIKTYHETTVRNATLVGLVDWLLQKNEEELMWKFYHKYWTKMRPEMQNLNDSASSGHQVAVTVGDEASSEACTNVGQSDSSERCAARIGSKAVVGDSASSCQSPHSHVVEDKNLVDEANKGVSETGNEEERFCAGEDEMYSDEYDEEYWGWSRQNQRDSDVIIESDDGD